MKKIVVLIFVPFLFFFISCPIPLNFTITPSIGVDLDKQEVCINEPLELSAHITKLYFDRTTHAIVYIENYPSNYQILRGTKYEPLTTEKYLCISPEKLKNNEGMIKVLLSFQTAGEYSIKVNATSSRAQDLLQGWTKEEFSTYTIVVKE